MATFLAAMAVVFLLESAGPAPSGQRLPLTAGDPVTISLTNNCEGVILQPFYMGAGFKAGKTEKKWNDKTKKYEKGSDILMQIRTWETGNVGVYQDYATQSGYGFLKMIVYEAVDTKSEDEVSLVELQKELEEAKKLRSTVKEIKSLEDEIGELQQKISDTPPMPKVPGKRIGIFTLDRIDVSPNCEHNISAQFCEFDLEMMQKHHLKARAWNNSAVYIAGYHN